MLGKRKVDRELFDVGNVYPLALSPKSFHAQLAKAGSRLFKDEDFAAIYHDKLGRPSVPPSVLAIATLLQHEAQVSDEEAVARTAYDLRWAAALGKSAGTPLCAKSTLQLFRGQLVLHEQMRTVFVGSIKEAKRAGLLKGKALRTAIDTKPILGRGAVQDTYNLLATGIRQLATALAKNANRKPDAWLSEQGLGRYSEPSVKGSADIDWSDSKARDALITEIVQDARKLVSMVSASDDKVREASELLQKLLLQDVEETVSSTGEPEAKIKEGTAQDRIPSATDPEQRHGRKSKSRRFVGSKASVVTDIDSQIVVAADVIPGNAGDATGALALIEQAEENTGQAVEETLGDCAYGSGEVRQSFHEAGRALVAKVPAENTNGGLFPKSAFKIDLEASTVTCPAGQIVVQCSASADGHKHYSFGCVCSSCALASGCTSSAGGRSISVHPQEALLMQARTYQQTEEGRSHLRERVVIEHRLARLGQLGIGQARYTGLSKTRFQLLIAATIANLRRTWNWEQAQEAASAVMFCALGVMRQALYAAVGVLGSAIRLLAAMVADHPRSSACGRYSQHTSQMTLSRPGF